LSLAPYLSPDEREARLDALAADLGAEVRVFGHSVEGRPLRLARVPSVSSGVSDRVLVCANIHGPELIGSAVALGFLAALARPAPSLARLRERAEIWVVPALNPDGYAHTWERDGVGLLRELRANAHGVDLNRNFPVPAPPPWWAPSFGGWARGSSDPDNAFYRGPAPLSEPETAAMAALLRRTPFVASVSLHSFFGKVIPAYVRRRDHFETYRRLAEAFCTAQTGARYACISSRVLDWHTGEMEDFQHHECRTWAICVECFGLAATVRQSLRAPSTFWRFNPRDPAPYVESDAPALAVFFHAALDLGPVR